MDLKISWAFRPRCVGQNAARFCPERPIRDIPKKDIFVNSGNYLRRTITKMRKIMISLTVLAGFAAGAYAQNAVEQLKDSYSGKAISAPEAANAALIPAANAVCSPESAAASYIKSVKQGGGVTNLKINASLSQIGNGKKKIVIVGSYKQETPMFDYSKVIPMAGYAFYDAETCAIGENLRVMTHDAPAAQPIDQSVCSTARAEDGYIKALNQAGSVTNLKTSASLSQLGGDKKKIVVIASYDRETPAFDYTKTIPMAGYAFYDAETCAIGENLSVATHSAE